MGAFLCIRAGITISTSDVLFSRGDSEMEKGVVKISVIIAAVLITLGSLGLYVMAEESNKPNVGYTLNYDLYNPLSLPIDGTLKMKIIDEKAKKVCWEYTIYTDDLINGTTCAVFSQWSPKDPSGKPSYGDPDGTDTAPDGVLYDIYSRTVAGMKTVSYVDNDDGFPYWIEITVDGTPVMFKYVP